MTFCVVVPIYNGAATLEASRKTAWLKRLFVCLLGVRRTANLFSKNSCETIVFNGFFTFSHREFDILYTYEEGFCR